jgi:putative hydrolase of the HAD superfamily
MMKFFKKSGEKKNKKIKAIVFDIGGVLFLKRFSFSNNHNRDFIGVHQYMADKYKLTLDDWFDYIDTPYSKSMEGLISKEKAVSTIAKRLKTTSDMLISSWKWAYRIKVKKNRKLYRLASKLGKMGYIVGVLSDQWHISKEILANEKDLKCFNPRLISCDLGMRKPNPKIYNLLIRKLKVKPNEILFIDDRDWNIIPAKKLGMKTILFKNNKDFIKELENLNII